jgi:hypothetical protein
MNHHLNRAVTEMSKESMQAIKGGAATETIYIDGVAVTQLKAVVDERFRSGHFAAPLYASSVSGPGVRV